MNKLEFEILRLLKENENAYLAGIARTLYKNEDSVKVAYNTLITKGLVKGDKVTPKGMEILEKHRINNALILAAGMSARFVPLNFDKPKGLLPVKGETLIERQIRQLNEKGITDIAVVVGYMKEDFDFLKDKYGVKLIVAEDYETRNNHASIYAARDFLKNTIITSSDLYFTENIFQTYAYDSYYCTTYVPGKTAERGIVTDSEDKIIETFYGDKCYDIWVTLGHAFFSEEFSQKMLGYIKEEFDRPETANKFWADIQDEHLADLYMYAKRCDDGVIHEFDSLEELRQFDANYLYDSGSRVMKKLCKLLAVDESKIVGLESMRKIKPSLFKFRCRGDVYVCDVQPEAKDRITYQGRVFYQIRDFENEELKLYKMDRDIKINGGYEINVNGILDNLYNYSKEFKEYHEKALPLCAAENVISPFADLPLSYGFQERYIMNNTYSFNMDDNFIGCEKLFPYYEEISKVCERLFGAKYTDPRPFTGMHTIDMVAKCVCEPGETIMILDKSAGGHASVKPVLERIGQKVVTAPYNFAINDLDYDKLNAQVKEEDIKYVLLCPSDLVKVLDVEKIDTTNCILMYDCSQVMGLIAGGLAPNPMKTKSNLIMLAGTHKTFPGPASGIIMTNEKYLHDKLEKMINPTLTRHPQMHQKICLLFALIEFEQYGAAYMSHMVHCSNYLGKKLREYGFEVGEFDGHVSQTHQVFFYTSKEVMDQIYDNAYKCKVTLNKKHKTLFHDYGIRLGTQEIARYNWDDAALDTIAAIIEKLTHKDLNVDEVRKMIATLPPKKIQFAFPDEVVDRFRELMK